MSESRRRLGSRGSDSSQSSAASVWEDFNKNGRDGDLDDLDKLFRGVDLNACKCIIGFSSGCERRQTDSPAVSWPESYRVLITIIHS